MQLFSRLQAAADMDLAGRIVDHVDPPTRRHEKMAPDQHHSDEPSDPLETHGSSSVDGQGENASASTAPGRLASLDTYRGIAMFLMVAEVLELCEVAKHFSGNWLWQQLCIHQSHVAWVGCTLHDMIQPSFTFMVGVSLPFSIAKRRALGQSMTWVTVHAFWRAIVLVFLGIFLRSLRSEQTNFTFDDTLTQIGLGYGFLFIIGLWSTRAQWIALVLILVGYWAAFAAYPLPAADFDYTTVGVPNDWPHLMDGFEAHWNKNSNLAHHFDVWFLNKLPRPEPFLFHGGGYHTLSFIPTLGTMIMGLIAGGFLRGGLSSLSKVGVLLGLGAVFLGAGYGLEMAGICPLVKRIWTPSWTLYSGGWCFIILAVLYVLIDLFRMRWLGFPFIVIGMNSIAIYCMSWMSEGLVQDNVHRHFGSAWIDLFDARFHHLIEGGIIVGIFWLILFWLYRQRAFLRISICWSLLDAG